MSYLNNLFKNKKIYFLIFTLIILFFISIIILFNIKISKSIPAILEVDENKNFTLVFSSSNIQLISNKSMSIVLENKRYLLENIELINLGECRYAVKFHNDNLLDIIQTKSIFNVTILMEEQSLIKSFF